MDGKLKPALVRFDIHPELTDYGKLFGELGESDIYSKAESKPEPEPTPPAPVNRMAELDKALECLKANEGKPTTEGDLLRTYLMLSLSLQIENTKLHETIAALRRGEHV